MPVKLSSKLPAEWHENGLDSMTVRLVAAGEEEAKTGHVVEDGQLLVVALVGVHSITRKVAEDITVPTVAIERIEPIPHEHRLYEAARRLLDDASQDRTGRQPALWSVDPATGEIRDGRPRVIGITEPRP